MPHPSILCTTTFFLPLILPTLKRPPPRLDAANETKKVCVAMMQSDNKVLRQIAKKVTHSLRSIAGLAHHPATPSPQ